MFKEPKIMVIFLLLFLILLPIIAFAQTATGKFTFVQGRVDVLRQPATRAVPVKMGDAVFVGDIIRAKSASKAEITFTDGNVVKIAPNTRVEISEYMFEESKGKGILKLSRGKVQAIVQQKIAKKIAAFGEANRFEIHTPTAIAGVRGTNFIVSFQRNSTSVLVLEGYVNTYNPKFPDIAVTLTAGYITTIPLNQPPQPARLATDAEKNMYKGDFSPGESGKKSETEDTVISEATSGSAEPGLPEEPPSPPSPPSPVTPETPPFTETFGTDTIPPVITISGPPPLTPLKDAVFNVSADETVTFTYIIDNKVVIVSPNTSLDNFIIPGLDDGNHIVTVIATDQAGNKTTMNYIWTIDATGPIVTITPTSASPQTEPTLTTLNINFSSNEPATYYYTYTLDGKGETGTGPLISIPNVSEGSYTLNIDVQAKDDLQNPSSIPSSFDFDLSRYSLGGSFYGCIAGVYGTASGEVAGISNQDWGGWNIQMSGEGDYPNKKWTLYAGGISSDNIETNDYGYWLLIADGSTNYDSKILSGISTLKYLSQDRLGFGEGILNGEYLCNEGCSYELTDIGSGTYNEAPLSFGGSTSGSFMYWNGEMEEMSDVGMMQGLMGGTESLWSGSPSFLSLGTYEGQNGNTLWGMDIGTEVSSGWTSDDGAFLGSIGGIALNDNLEGLAIGIYIKQNDVEYETGYFYSDSIKGSLFPEINMYELNGNLTAVSMGTTSISPSKLSSSIDFDEEDHGTIAGDITGYISIESANLVDQNWGLWRAGGGGTYDSISSDEWTATISDIEYGEEEIIGYTLANLTGTAWSEGKLSGTVIGKFLNVDTMGTFSGSLIGIYTENDANFWQALGCGVYTEVPLAFGGILNSGSFQWDQDFWLVVDGGLTGLMGIAELNGLTSFFSLGTYNSDYETGNLYNGALWGVDIVDSTPDNGAILGVTGGIVLEDNELRDSLLGGLRAIYIKPTEEEGHEAGYIVSSNVSGYLYPEIGMYELDGNLTAVSMGTTSILPDNLNWDTVYGDTPSLHLVKGYGAIEGDLSGEIGFQSINLSDQNWGIWYGSSVSYYSEENPLIPSSWTAIAEGDSYGLIYGEEGPYLDLVGYWGSQITGNRIDTGNKLIGTSVGYLADISSTPFTAISAGETIGTFNPNDYTWQAVSMGVWIETNKFLQMAGKVEGVPSNIEALQKLNIPCVEVGRASLSGSGSSEGGGINVNMNNVIFFAPNTNARPSIWATNSVNGSYTGNPLGTVVGLSGDGLSANFNVRQWDTTNNKWLSTVTDGHGNIIGGGPNVQNLNFHGTAAGTYTGTTSGYISGTAAGVAK